MVQLIQVLGQKTTPGHTKENTVGANNGQLCGDVGAIAGAKDGVIGEEAAGLTATDIWKGAETTEVSDRQFVRLHMAGFI